MLFCFRNVYYDARMSRWISTDPALAEGKYFPKPNDYDTEHDFYWYLQQDGSKKLPGIGGVFNAVNMDIYHYAGQNPVKLVDPDGEAFVVGAISGFIGGVATEIFLQAAGNLISGKSTFEDLDVSDILVSGAIGAGTGAVGVGVIAQGKKFIDAYKQYKIASTAYKARQLAIAAGKVRNAKKTEKVLKKVIFARKEMAKAGLKASGIIIAKKSAKHAVDKINNDKIDKK